MYDFLVDHALKNVWCTPDQDRQLIIQPVKITGIGGVWNTVDVYWRNITLPLLATRFHVYQFGQIYPALINLIDGAENTWFKLSDSCNSNNVIVNIYCDNGLQLPVTEIWYMITPDRNIVLAVKDQPKINVNLNIDPIYFRVYNNAYFSTSRSDPLNDYIKIDGGTVYNNADILNFQNKFNIVNALPGATYAFVNGIKVSSIDLISTKPNDVIEFIYDSSIRTIIDLPFSNLQSFVSTLDGKHKYLVHYPDVGDNSIDYQDDIDFFIINTLPNNRHNGVFYHRNQEDSVRMLTHKDYSIVVPYAVGYISSVSGWTDIANLTLRLHIRKSGYKRNLVFENSRIEELYKLPDGKVLAAMIGVNSDVSVWRADALESAGYAAIMRSNFPQVTRKLVQDGYGYNAISKLIADTPNKVSVINGANAVPVPYGLISNSVAYEYDSSGLLINWYQHQSYTEYNTVNPNTNLVELISGIGGNTLDETYGVMASILDSSAEYRYYTCPIVSGMITNKWTDVTNTPAYMVNSNIATWLVDPTLFYTLIRSNKKILAYDLNLFASNGLLSFSLEHLQTRNGNIVNTIMQIPMGELDLFLNGYSLVEGVDYNVNFPEIVIINKNYLQNILTDSQKVTIRFSGFCNPDFSRNVIADKGFIKYDLLSHNNRFDIRDDKVLRIVVGGKLFDRSSLLFSELDSGITVPSINNGLPYQIRDIVVPLKGIAVDDTYIARSKSLSIDKSISDYMTSWFPEPVITTPNVIVQLYPIYSPFCSRIIYDLQTGVLSDPKLMQQYSDSDVIDICKPYEYLLKFDPTQNGLQQDSSYVIIHPHNLNTVINVDIYMYKFITRVVALYMNGLVNISNFINLTQ